MKPRTAPSRIQWGFVQHTAARIAIVGSGPSLRNVDLHIPQGITVIAVNAAIQLLPARPDFWFTMDTSESNRAIMAAPLEGTAYYAAVLAGFTMLEPHCTYLRRIHGNGPYMAKLGLSDDPKGVHAGNSGYGALNLAYHMRPQKVALLGIDGQGGYAHGSGVPGGNLFHLGRLFASASAQLAQRGIEVLTGSPTSKVNCWPRVQPVEALAWLAS